MYNLSEETIIEINKLITDWNNKDLDDFNDNKIDKQILNFNLKMSNIMIQIIEKFQKDNNIEELITILKYGENRCKEKSNNAT
jgi:hypothetical protein